MAAGRPASNRPTAGQQPTGQQQPTGRPQLAAGKPAAAAAWRGVFARAFYWRVNLRPAPGAGVDNVDNVDNGFLAGALRCYCGHCGQVKSNSPHYPQKGKGKSRQQKGMGKRGQYGQYGQVLFKSYYSNPIYTNFNS
jgi:hypothetical protein